MKRSMFLFLCAAILAVSVFSGCSRNYRSRYEQAQALYAENRFEEAAAAFEELGSYSDSEKMKQYCRAAAAGEDGKYLSAYVSFTQLGGFKDSGTMILYYEARELEAGGPDTLAEAAEAYEALDGFRDSADRAEACREALYQAGRAELDAGHYYTANKYLSGIKGYRDADSLLDDPGMKAGLVGVGDTVFFGSYEQDNDMSDGKEPVEWLILDMADGEALVIAKYGLDAAAYHEEWESTAWETCTLRAWLNDDFLNEAFSEDEQERIRETAVTAETNPEYDTDPGNDTEDRVFLLSIAEAEKYFGSDEERVCTVTEYAFEQGSYTYDPETREVHMKKDDSNQEYSGSACCWWWLRSPGYNDSNAAAVYDSGGILSDGSRVSESEIAVRPAMWLKLE